MNEQTLMDKLGPIIVPFVDIFTGDDDGEFPLQVMVGIAASFVGIVAVMIAIRWLLRAAKKVK